MSEVQLFINAYKLLTESGENPAYKYLLNIWFLCLLFYS